MILSMASNYKTFTCNCAQCGGLTSKSYARLHNGQCKICVTGIVPRIPRTEAEDRTNPDMYSHMGGSCRGDDLGLSPDF